ncbi:MAG: 30S ribosomal protein S20 [Solirubrobacterales bacterium]
MANITSQKKRIARSERERLENRRLTSAVKTQFRKLEETVSSGSGDAETELKQLVSRVDKAMRKGALHRNTGARKKSRASRLLRPKA